MSEAREVLMLAEHGSSRPQTTIEDIEIGRDLGQLEWVVTRSKVEGLIASDEEFDPWFVGAEEGGGDIAPGLATYPPVRALFARTFNIRGFLYEYECEFFRPIKYGQVLVISGRIADTWVKRHREYVRFEAEARDPDGDLYFQTSRTHLLDYLTLEPPVVGADQR